MNETDRSRLFAGTQCPRGTVWTWAASWRSPTRTVLAPATATACSARGSRSSRPSYRAPACRCSRRWWTCRPRKPCCPWSGRRSSTRSWAKRPPSGRVPRRRRRRPICTCSTPRRRPSRTRWTCRRRRRRARNRAKATPPRRSATGKALRPRLQPPARSLKRSSTYRPRSAWRCKSPAKRPPPPSAATADDSAACRRLQRPNRARPPRPTGRCRVSRPAVAPASSLRRSITTNKPVAVRTARTSPRWPRGRWTTCAISSAPSTCAPNTLR